MRNGSKKWFALALVGVGAVGSWTLGQSIFGSDEAHGTGHLVNQVWIDRVPEDRRDMIAHLLVMDHPQGKVGVTGRSSQWRHLIEVFMWRLQGDRLSVVFPQEKVKANLRAETWDCEDEAPQPFELCLRLTSGDRSMVMYSRHEWKVRPHELEASLAELGETSPELAAIVGADPGSFELGEIAEFDDAVESDWLP